MYNIEATRICVDLGLVTEKGGLKISNPIYREVIARELTYVSQRTMAEPEFKWLNENSFFAHYVPSFQ